ncbi:Hypothetical protein SRAE_X000101300 [Strongyloides ratti]|uniref:Uncharacterized protein n=1 Tax=Strongyloides ratti TaxID=34506 RepID=A0A090KVK6_STRRB|nr:Hypothetical protein SRAE_X000101300 [Strongyloides ratti]CEF59262.1 Hypothetical protein SRAE_X000101300 [Strongyloides ratti]
MSRRIVNNDQSQNGRNSANAVSDYNNFDNHEYSISNSYDLEDHTDKDIEKTIQKFEKTLYIYGGTNTTCSEVVQNVYTICNEETNLVKLPLLNDPGFKFILEKYEISQLFLENIMKMEICDDIKYTDNTFSSTTLSRIHDLLLDKKVNFFKRVEQILYMALRYYLIQYNESFNRVHLLNSIEKQLLDILNAPITFEIRKLLLTIIILIATHPSIKERYMIASEHFVKLISYNVIMLHYTPEMNNIVKETIPKDEEYEYRLMVKTFIDEFCCNTSFKKLPNCVYAINDFLGLFQNVSTDMVKEMYFFVTNSNVNKIQYEKKMKKIVALIKCLKMPLLNLCNPAKAKCLYKCSRVFEIFKFVTKFVTLIWDNNDIKKNISKNSFNISTKEIFVEIASAVLPICSVQTENYHMKKCFYLVSKWKRIMNTLFVLENPDDQYEKLTLNFNLYNSFAFYKVEYERLYIKYCRNLGYKMSFD